MATANQARVKLKAAYVAHHRTLKVSLSDELSSELGAAIGTVLNSGGHPDGAPALAAAMNKLTDEAIAGFLVDILDRMELGMMARKTIDIGTQMASKGFSFIINRLIATLSQEQLMMVARHLEETTAPD